MQGAICMIGPTLACQVRENTSGGKHAWSAPSESPSEQLSSSGIQSGNARGGALRPPWSGVCMPSYSHAIVFSFSLHVQYDCVQYLTCIIKKIVRFCKA